MCDEQKPVPESVRAAVGEFEREYVPVPPTAGKHLFTAEVPEFKSWLLAALSRVDAAARADERIEALKEARDLIYQHVEPYHSDAGRLCEEVLTAAIEGRDLTNLTDEQ